MRKLLSVLLAAISFAAFPISAQQPVSKVTAQEIDTPPFNPAPAVSNFSAAPSFQGNATCYYWIITQTTTPVIATSAPLALPLFICPTTAGGTTQNPVSLNWTLVPGATYDVLETTTSTMPVGTNTVAIATGITNGNLTDTGQARSSYTLIPAGLSWQEFNNLIAGIPTLQWCYNGTCVLNVTPTGVNTPSGGFPSALTMPQEYIVTTTTTPQGNAVTWATEPPGYVLQVPPPGLSGYEGTAYGQYISNGTGGDPGGNIVITRTPPTATSFGVLTANAANSLATPAGWTQVSTQSMLWFKAITGTTPVTTAQAVSAGGNDGIGAFSLFTGPAPSLIQSANATPGIVSAGTLAFGSNNTAGNTIIVAIKALTFSPTNPITFSITNDTNGNNYNQIVSQQITGPDHGTSIVYSDALFVATGIAAGANTISYAVNGANRGVVITISEFGPLNPGNSIPSFGPLNQSVANATSISKFSSATLGGNVTVSSTAATTILSLAVTMPTSGCPCRADVRYSLYATSSTANNTAMDFWITDGTNTFPGVQTGQSNASTGARTSVTQSVLSPVTYNSGQAVTFTIMGEYTNTPTASTSFVVEAAPQIGSGGNSSMQIAVVTSR